jgi:histone-lysine N-methyltransferase SETD2
MVLVLQTLLNWKLSIRNKIEDSNIEESIKVLRDGPDEELSDMSGQLLEYWSTLELSYKIPRKTKIASVSGYLLGLR